MRDGEIVVVDDDLGDLRLIEEAFSGEAGVSVKTFEGAEPALRYLSENPKAHRVVLLDLNMPGLDGFEMLEKIKSDEKLAGIPVVIFTTSDSPADVRACYARHANGFITKPDDFARYRTIARRVRDFWFDTVTLPE